MSDEALSLVKDYHTGAVVYNYYGSASPKGKLHDKDGNLINTYEQVWVNNTPGGILKALFDSTNTPVPMYTSDWLTNELWSVDGYTGNDIKQHDGGQAYPGGRPTTLDYVAGMDTVNPPQPGTGTGGTGTGGTGTGTGTDTGTGGTGTGGTGTGTGTDTGTGGTGTGTGGTGTGTGTDTGTGGTGTGTGGTGTGTGGTGTGGTGTGTGGTGTGGTGTGGTGTGGTGTGGTGTGTDPVLEPVFDEYDLIEAMGDEAPTIEVARAAVRAATDLIDTYTRGAAYRRIRVPRPGVNAVVHTVAARIAANPGFITRRDQAGNFSRSLGAGFNGFTLTEKTVLENYRRTAR